MKAIRIISRFIHIILWIILAVVLLVAGVLLTLYSSWGQNMLRERLVAKMNTIPGIEMSISDFRLHFPLTLDLAGVYLIQDADTMVRVDTLHAKVALMPLLAGNVDIQKARLIDGFYRMGNADSLMCLKIKAHELDIEPASIGLSQMDINIKDGTLKGAVIDIALKPDTSTVTDTSAVNPMKIKLQKLHLDDFTYRMSMLPTIDSLGTNIAKGLLSYGEIDLMAQTVKLKTFRALGLNAAYIAPDSATVVEYDRLYPTLLQPDTVASVPWTITIDTIHATESQALYTTAGWEPLPGLDFGYIQVYDLDLMVTDFYNQATKLSLPIQLHGTERCGVTLDADGTFAMDSVAMYFRDFHVSTPSTVLSADGMLGVGDLLTDTSLPLALKADGYCSFADMMLMFPDFKPYLTLLPRGGNANLALDLKGTAGNINISDLMLGISGHARINGRGSVQNAFLPTGLGCDLTLNGAIINVNSIVKGLTTPDMGLVVPPMTLAGHLKMRNSDINGSLKANTLGGQLALDASLAGKTDAYKLMLTTHQFPVNAFMPDLGVGKATIDVKAVGTGFDILNPKTHLNAQAQIKDLDYQGYDYHDINLNADIANGEATVKGGIKAKEIVVSLDGHCNITGDAYHWTANLYGDIPDMQDLKLSETPMGMTATLETTGTYTIKTNEIDAQIHVPEFTYRGTEDTEFELSNIKAHFLSNDSLTRATLTNRDLNATLFTPTSLAEISVDMDSVMAIIDRQIASRKVEVDTIQRALPKFDFHLIAGDDNMINDILASQKTSIQHLTVNANNDSVLALKSNILNITTSTARIDTINFDVAQEGNKMHILGLMDNKPGNMDDWAHVRLDGMLNTDRLSLRILQRNVKNVTGFDLGAITVLQDSTITARLFPLSPVIGNKKWSVNLDNYISYNFLTHNIDANLKMKGADSSIALHTERNAQNDSINNIVLNISDIHLADWISFNPFAPPISGNLSAMVNVNWDGGTNINGTGNISLTDFLYDKRKVSSFELNLAAMTNLDGEVRAQADLLVDGEKTMSLAGILNQENAENPFNLDLSVIKFPLATVNPFLSEDLAQLKGTLNGNMAVTGNMDNPKINGEIYFSDAAIRMAMTNTSYNISTVKIPVVDNIVSFNDFNITAANENPLYINGTVNLKSLMSPQIDLGMKAKNIMVVNTNRASRNAIIYGKAYLNLDATAKGNMRFMDVDANVTVLSGTNVTYILTDEASDLTSISNEGMVKFVNLNDTAAVIAADSLSTETMLMKIDAQLNIQTGTTITVNLPTGSRDKVQLQPDGYLTYTQAPMSDGRMTGRINITSGYARYTLPVIGSEKMFTFQPDSYVVFNGDILNPVLNIHANDQVKTNVTPDGQNSRLVNFDISLSVTGTLEQMDVAFDLSTDDDLTIANELQSMTAQQRANQAMNMLLYNMYTGPGVSNGGLSLSANPLFSFLESQINNWAANNIKGVDLSFGIDQYNQTTNGSTSSTMNYSYQVSKTLFNDRFKIVVGGNYSTDSNADENLAENLINDISFEYFLNKQQTMLVRIFRHVGYESILEGEITQTGVGFMYRRKLDRLVNILPKFMRPKYKKGL